MFIHDDYLGEKYDETVVTLLNFALHDKDYGATVTELVYSVVFDDGYTHPDPGWVRTLPSGKLVRKARTALIAFHSHVSFRELEKGRPGEPWIQPCPSIEWVAPHFDSIVGEFVDAIACLRPLLERKDDFRVDDLIADIRDYAASVPRSQPAFRELMLRAIEWDRVHSANRAKAREAELLSGKASLSEQEFWDIVALLRPDGRTKAAAAVKALARRSARDIVEFEDILAEKLFALDTERHACRGGPGPYEGSGDGFLYARCLAVAMGRAFYENARTDPRALPHGECEDLLYIASRAFEARTGQRLSHTSRFNYETGSNNAGWPQR